jgi:hypothetical protein
VTAAALLDAWTSYARSLRLWVLDFVAWLATVLQWRDLRVLARADLRHLRAEVRFLLVTRLAIAMQEGLIAPKQTQPVFSRRHVDLFLSRRRFTRFALRGVRLETLDQCRCVLDRLEAVALRCARNLDGGVAVRALHWRVDELVRVQGMCEVAHVPDTS